MPANLGAELPGTIGLTSAEARLFERGMSIKTAHGEIAVEFTLPPLVRPIIRTGQPPTPFLAEGVTVHHASHQLAQVKPVVAEALEGRLHLTPSGAQGDRRNLRLGTFTASQEGSRCSLEVDGTLAHRQLYDISSSTSSGVDQVLAPNAVYYRDDWSNFGLAHITDMHVARRIDGFRALLRKSKKWPDAADRFHNWNDRFRGFVKYANYLHDEGKLDVILATGDLYDFIHEDDDDPEGSGNAGFLRKLILGQAQGPDFPDVEALRVPLYAVPGNHDYRLHPYRLVFDLNVAHKDLKRFHNFAGYNLKELEAIELELRLHGMPDEQVDAAENMGMNLVANLGTDATARMVQIEADNSAYVSQLGPVGSYVVELGPHKIAMIDSGPDVGVIDDAWGAIRTWLGYISEDEASFVGGSPNCCGVTDQAYDDTVQALSQTADAGLFIVGLHAPLFNPRYYPYFLRETQRASQGDQVEAFLAFQSGVIGQSFTENTREEVRKRHPTWFPPSNDHRAPTFVKRVDAEDLLDCGVSRSRAEDLTKALAGMTGLRPANLVLAGHTHDHNEFCVRRNWWGEMSFFMDFYTQNPSAYYPTKYMSSWHDGSFPQKRETMVDVVAGASAQLQPWDFPSDHRPKVVQVPHYPDSLNEASDAKEWWSRHGLLVLQTGALGPIEDSYVNFSGFRVITIADNVIKAINFISSDRLAQHGYALSWEDATRIDPPRQLPYVGRSEQYGMPAAVYPPSVAQLSPSAYNIIYRDSPGHVLELWSDSGQSGTGNLTAVAQAPAAAGLAVPYVNTNTKQVIVPYRAADGTIHSVYLLPGTTGHDDLSAVSKCPKAEGNPVGFYDAQTDEHRIIYRTKDGHLHSIYWHANDAASHEDLFWSNFPPAAGDAAPYSAGGTNVIAYRGTDGGIHSLYWSGNNAVQHDGLSSFAHMPLAAGDPVAYHYKGPDGDVHQVTYRAVDGQIIELWWVGVAPVQGWSVTAAAGAPSAAFDPAAHYNPETGLKSVTYVSADGLVHEIAWTPGHGTPSHRQVTADEHWPRAQGRPAAFSQSADRTNHIVFTSQDGQVYEATSHYRVFQPHIGSASTSVLQPLVTG